ncbi:hypothetical protein Taro_006089 [Colocasia esculenta]|uniref:Pseudouridine synthase RsuA/RluA-like domain-containing protein n=1 Tax=Colocasia esculenta TaxID=4460 RepID=A0A843TZP5_COLES|nr:hypothetical protein [Colocasia esculenta]
MACPPAALSAALFASSLRALPRLASLLAPAAIFRAFSAGARPLTRRGDGAAWRPRVPRKATVPCYSSAEAVAPAATDSSSGSSLYASGCYEYNRLLPCPSQNRPPRVEHLVVSEGGPVLEYICKELDLPYLYVSDLIHFGAVYYALVCPTPPPTATPEQIEIFKKVTAPSVLQKRASIKGKTVREAQKTFRITHPNEFVEAGTYLRVHVHPKRFPRCYEVDWKSRIIAVTDTYVILDKPAATSVGGTTDNIEESCATFASRALGLKSPLLTTHQIDNCTEGCIVLAKTKDFCSYFHGLIRVRAQFAAIGAPIVGDSMYMPAAVSEMENPHINPFGKNKNYLNEDDRTNAAMEWIAKHGKEPSAAIGLQAFQISWDDGNFTYNAGPPWWRLRDG